MSFLNLQRRREYYRTKRGHASRFLEKATARSKAKNLPIDIDLDYVESIITDCCPVFGTTFVWGHNGNGRDNVQGPSLDRIIPELGYVKGNVVFISNLANRIKSDATEKELYAVADWLHDERKKVINAFQGKLTPVPEAPDTPGRKHSEHRVADVAWARQECDGAHHYHERSGWEDIGDRPASSSAIGVGSGVSKVGAPIDIADGVSDGHTETEIECAFEQLRYLRDKLRERPMAGGDLEALLFSVSNSGRKFEIQRPINKTIQSAEKSIAAVQEKDYINRHTDS